MKLCEMPGERPATDDGYLEIMTKAIFTAGLNWRVIEGKWPGFHKAFHDFSVAKVAAMTPDDIDRLAQDTSLVRNARKIAATIENANRMLALARQHGSLGAYLEALEAQGEETMVAAVCKQFAFLGDNSARGWLTATGHMQPMLAHA